MRDADLSIELVDYLERQLKLANGARVEFTPKLLSRKIPDSYPPSIGKVADGVITILRARGWKVRYMRDRNPRVFVINS